jgi:outer membrane protein assembly factor BamE
MPTMLALLRATSRTAVRFGVTGVIATAMLAGCASKNPLIDGPALSTSSAPGATTTATASVPATTDSAPTTTATNAAQSASAASANSGLQRTKPTTVRRFFGVFSPYRVDIPQGNFVTEEMLAQLKEGMTRDQVKFVLGTPLIADIFHADRWDYAFRMLKRNDEVLSSRVTVFFTDGKVSRFEGGNLPTEVDYLALIAGAAPKKTIEAAPKPAAAPSAAKPNQ